MPIGGHMKRTLAFVVTIALWLCGCAVADYIIPSTVGRCWIMLWGAIVAGVMLVSHVLIVD